MKKRSLFKKSIIFSAMTMFFSLVAFLISNNAVSFNDAPA